MPFYAFLELFIYVFAAKMFAANNTPTSNTSVGIYENKNLDKNIVLKYNKILKEMSDAKMSKNIYVISTSRSKKENDLLPLSAKNSFHLYGKAMDLIIGDINNDNSTNEKDVDDFIKIVKNVETKNAQLIGGIGTYKKSWYSCQMVHIDTRGYAAFWNY